MTKPSSLRCGVALEHRIGRRARTTKDLDIAMRAFPAARNALRDACDVSLDDFFTISIVNELLSRSS